MSTENFFFSKLKSEGILLAVIPLVGSLTAFAFEAGYLTYYDVPFELIELGLFRILKATVVLSVVLAFVWGIGARVFAIVRSDVPEIRDGWFAVFVIVVVIVVVWNIDFKTFDFKRLLFHLVWPVIVGVMYFVHRALSKDGVLGKRHPTMSKAYEDGQKVAEKGELYSNIYTGPFSVCLVFLMFVSIVGYWTAKFDADTWVLTDQPNFLLVRKYGEVYIFKEYDPTSKKIANRVQILSLADGKKLDLRLIHIGYLKSKFSDPTADTAIPKTEMTGKRVGDPAINLAQPSQ